MFMNEIGGFHPSLIVSKKGSTDFAVTQESTVHESASWTSFIFSHHHVILIVVSTYSALEIVVVILRSVVDLNILVFAKVRNSLWDILDFSLIFFMVDSCTKSEVTPIFKWPQFCKDKCLASFSSRDLEFQILSLWNSEVQRWAPKREIIEVKIYFLDFFINMIDNLNHHHSPSKLFWIHSLSSILIISSRSSNFFLICIISINLEI